MYIQQPSGECPFGLDQINKVPFISSVHQSYRRKLFAETHIDLTSMSVVD